MFPDIVTQSGDTQNKESACVWYGVNAPTSHNVFSTGLENHKIKKQTGDSEHVHTPTGFVAPVPQHAVWDGIPRPLICSFLQINDETESGLLIQFAIQVFGNQVCSKHKTLALCWFNVRPASPTLVQHRINTGCLQGNHSDTG